MPFIDQERFNKLVSVACRTSLQCDQAVQLLSGPDNFSIYDKLWFYFTEPVSGSYFKAAKIDIYFLNFNIFFCFCKFTFPCHIFSPAFTSAQCF